MPRTFNLGDTMQLIDKSLAAYQQALDLSSQAGSEGLLDSVARLGLGNGLRLKAGLPETGAERPGAVQFDRAIALVSQTVEPLRLAKQQRYLTQAYEYLGTAYQWKAYTYLVNQDFELGMPAYLQALDYYDQCIAQGKGTQDLVIKNEIIKGICQPNRDSIQQELDNLGGAQG
jgi:tetratricopeptide (TPR) repeat protein